MNSGLRDRPSIYYDCRAASQLRCWVTPATAEEYDYALRRTPELCRPFAAAMGDLRPAARCVLCLAAQG